MVVKIVTDSTADIPPEIARDLGITVVPVYVRFGNEVYRDGVDISSDGFYQKLLTSPVHPATSQPTPQDFAQVYSDCGQETGGIISIHVSAKVSGTYSSAMQGQKLTKGKCQIEVVDSGFTSVGLALAVMAAARLAKAGGSLPEVFRETRRAIDQIRMLGIVETLKYLVLGGRVSKTIAAVANVLNIKPLLTFRNGEIVRAGLVRTYSQGLHRLYEFVKSNSAIQDLAIAYSTVPELASQMKSLIGSSFPQEKILTTQLGAGLGVHVGPGTLVLALRHR